MIPAGMAGYPITFRITHGRKETRRGPEFEVILEFPSLKRPRRGVTTPPIKSTGLMAATIAPSSSKGADEGG
jgi:hypothetical protein